MDNLTICDTFVRQKRVFSDNLNYLKHVVTYVNVYNFGGSMLQRRRLSVPVYDYLNNCVCCVSELKHFKGFRRTISFTIIITLLLITLLSIVPFEGISCFK